VSVTSQYHFKSRCEGDFGFSPYDSLESLVVCDKISCRWVRGSPERKEEKGATPKRRYFTAIGLSSVKMVADRDILLIITSTDDELLRNVSIDDLECP